MNILLQSIIAYKDLLRAILRQMLETFLKPNERFVRQCLHGRKNLNTLIQVENLFVFEEKKRFFNVSLFWSLRIKL